MLNGVNVLDFSRVLAGPLCTMILGDLGANILKVERPITGDETRGWGPPFGSSGQSAYFLSINRNKKSLVADIDAAADRRLLTALLAEAHVVVENFRTGSLVSRGLDPKALLVRHPTLIWCTVTGFGPESPRPGYDFVVQAECGWMAITGEPNGNPMKVGVALADVLAGKDAAIAILAALTTVRAGQRLTAERRHLHISLAASASAALVNVAQNALVTGAEATRWGNAHANLVPYELFDTADRPIVVAIGSDDQWLRCTTALELPALRADESLRTNSGRLAQRARVVGEISRCLRHRSASEWIERLNSVGVPCGLVRSVLDVVREAGGSALTGMPPSVPGSVRFPPPALDEHGTDLRSRGWDAFSAAPS
jgi:crotonobetainyl-CoA:carnitine CoA-transferase CaiB-like acyl-CoA transferase